jgi:hypothetical protein
MRTDDARHLVSRVFGAIGGVLTGAGAAIAQWGFGMPTDGARGAIFAVLLVVAGGLLCTFGIGMALSAMAARNIARLDVFVFWVLLPGALAFFATWWLIGHFFDSVATAVALALAGAPFA